VPGRPAVGHAVSGTVEDDHAREGRQTVEELGEGGVVPLQREVGRPAEQEDEVEIAGPEHLVGDGRALRIPREVDGRAVPHAGAP
jgi:hypothetical protein